MKKLQKQQPETIEYDPRKAYQKWRNIRAKIFYRWNMRFNPDRRYLIRMYMRNRDVDNFILFPKSDNFVYKGGMYILDDSQARYHVSSDSYELQYHEDLSVPFHFEPDISEMKTVISKVSDMKTALNPKVLEQSQRSKIVQNMMSGAGLPEMVQKIFVVAMITLVVIVLYVILYLYKTGVFEQVGAIV